MCKKAAAANCQKNHEPATVLTAVCLSFFCVCYVPKQKTLNFCNSIIMWKILLDVRLKLEIVTSLYITEILLRYFIELQWNIIE